MKRSAIAKLCSTLELAGEARGDIDSCRVRPGDGMVDQVLVELLTGSGTVRRIIDASVDRICDGRTCRQVFDDWIGREMTLTQAPVLDAQPLTMLDLLGHPCSPWTRAGWKAETEAIERSVDAIEGEQDEV